MGLIDLKLIDLKTEYLNSMREAQKVKYGEIDGEYLNRMREALNTEFEKIRTEYLNSMYESLKSVRLEKFGGGEFSFSELYFPLNVDEGKYAFGGYSDQMHIACELANGTESDNTEADTVSEEDDGTEIELPPVDMKYSFLVDVNGKMARDSAADYRKLFSIALRRLREEQAARQFMFASDYEGKQYLRNETEWERSSLMLSLEDHAYSRIIAIASAGHGKTTLLRRIALCYCRSDREDEADNAVRSKYNLLQDVHGGYVPCIILLRELAGNPVSPEEAIENSMSAVLSRAEHSVSRGVLRAWIDANRYRLLLLIDGLDELTDAAKTVFLNDLKAYLDKYNRTRVIMTSRASGLSDVGVYSALEKMHFHGRSIIPLTDKDAKEYAERWLEITQPKEEQERLKSYLEQIMNESRFGYLKEFMRTPLELIIMLKQMANYNISLNRSKMFGDMLREVFTNHAALSVKSMVFDDTMTLLGYIAYDMQNRGSLFVSRENLNGILEELNKLSFHTDIMGEGTVEDCMAFLDSLASNVGIVDKAQEEETDVYTVPIRSYQEYLAAYACCHLRLNSEKTGPDPVEIVLPHMNDAAWHGVINFVLSDLNTSNPDAFDVLLDKVFAATNNMGLIRSVIEADLPISREHAMVLCKNVFSDEILNDRTSSLLLSCMETKSTYAYMLALKWLYYHSEDERAYLEAYVTASIIMEHYSIRSIYECAYDMIKCDSIKKKRAGAVMLSAISKTCTEDGKARSVICFKEVGILMRRTMCVFDTLLDNAVKYGDEYSAVALWELMPLADDGIMPSPGWTNLNATVRQFMIYKTVGVERGSFGFMDYFCEQNPNTDISKTIELIRPVYKHENRMMEMVNSIAYVINLKPKTLVDVIDYIEDPGFDSLFEDYLYNMPISRESVDEMLDFITGWDFEAVYRKLLTECLELLTPDEIEKLKSDYRETFSAPLPDEDD